MYLLVVYSIDYSTCVSYYYYIIYLEGNTVVYCVYIHILYSKYYIFISRVLNILIYIYIYIYVFIYLI